MASRNFRRPSIRQPLRTYGNVELKGLREYQERLGELGADMMDRGLVLSLGAGSLVMRDAVRQYAPVLRAPDPRRLPGTLKSAVVRMRSSVSRYSMTFVVGVRLLSAQAVRAFKVARARSGQRWSGNFNPHDPFYGPILELGKTPRTRHPFLKPGFNASAVRAVTVARDTLGGYTEAAIRRLGPGR